MVKAKPSAKNEVNRAAIDETWSTLIENEKRRQIPRGHIKKMPLVAPLSSESENDSGKPLPNTVNSRINKHTHQVNTWRLKEEHWATHPSNQFKTELFESITRILRGRKGTWQTLHPDTFKELYTQMREHTKKLWIKEGIWNDDWNWTNMLTWSWKPEGPPMTDASLEPSRSKSKQPLHVEIGLQIFEQQKELRSDPSRPLHRFIYHVSLVRERMQLVCDPPEQSTRKARLQERDLNSEAYVEVRELWKKRGIWDRVWSKLPGMEWRYEQRLQQMIFDEIGEPPIIPGEDEAEDDLLDPIINLSASELNAILERQNREGSTEGPSAAEANPSVAAPTQTRSSGRLRGKRKVDYSDEAADQGNSISLMSKEPRIKRRRKADEQDNLKEQKPSEPVGQHLRTIRRRY